MHASPERSVEKLTMNEANDGPAYVGWLIFNLGICDTSAAELQGSDIWGPVISSRRASFACVALLSCTDVLASHGRVLGK